MRLVLLIALAYLGYVGLFFALQRKILFPGASMAPLGSVSRASIPGLEVIWLEGDGFRSEAWYIPPDDASGDRPAPALIFTHGNAEFIDDWVRWLRPLADMGLGVLLVEYPGYGRSEGRPTEASVLAATVAAYDRLAARPDVDGGRIVALGRSVGGGPAAGLSRVRPLAALVLQSTFVSVGSMVRGRLLPSFLALDPMDNLAAVSAYGGPVLVLHGTRDEIIPFRHGERLAAAAPRGRLVPLDCSHNDCPPSWPEYWAEIEGFLEEAGVLGR